MHDAETVADGFTLPPTGSAVEPWSHRLATAFAGLLPEPLQHGPLDGGLAGTTLGPLGAYQVHGTLQVVRRTPSAVRDLPTEVLKVCLQVRGRATLHQAGRELVIERGQLAVYDTRRPYDLRLEGDWACSVLVFPPAALTLPTRWLPEAMGHVHDASRGPGTVLSSFVRAAVDGGGVEGQDDGSALRFADAGLQLLASTLTREARATTTGSGADARRLAVLAHIRQHLQEPSLDHASVAAAHGLSPRSLDRLFAGEPMTVTATIRDLRLDGARRELLHHRSAHRTVGAIAGRWCFPDAAHFSRLYRKRFGTTPSSERS